MIRSVFALCCEMNFFKNRTHINCRLQKIKTCVTSGSRLEVDENRALPGYYAASNSNSNSNSLLLIHYSLRNSPEERSSQTKTYLEPLINSATSSSHT